MTASSNKGLAFIAREEALVLVAFKDRESDAIGYSHHGAEVTPGLTWTPEQALVQLVLDCHVCATVLGRVITQPLPRTCWDALNSLSYNLGSGTVSRSPIIGAINKGDLAGAADLFTTSGWENPARREREQNLFLRGDYTPSLNGLALGQMLLFTSNPKAEPRPTAQTTVFPLALEA